MTNLPICGDCDGPITIAGDMGACACGSFPFDEDNEPWTVLRTRHVWASGEKTYFRDQLFNENNEEVSKLDLISDLLAQAGIQDGDEFTVRVEPTGNRPYGDRRLLAFGKEETEEECNARVSRITAKEHE